MGWVWGKAWTPISIWLECTVLGSSMKNPKSIFQLSRKKWG